MAKEDSKFHEAFEPVAPVIPDHEILRCIGRGSYGAVWLARNVLMGSWRAVKVIYRAAFAEPRPYERELQGIYRYEPHSRSHPGLVHVLHVGENSAEGYFYYIMELADDQERGQSIDPEQYSARTLGAELARRGRLPFSECVQLGLTLSSALGHLHRQELVHRDIKPSNIIFVNGVPKLADIGLVASVREANSYVGTEGYFPPEGPGTPPADIFSLGRVLYEISTGQDRHHFPSLPADLDQGPEQEQFSELNAVLLRACQNDVRKRYHTAEELQADLVFLLNGKSVRRLRLLEQRVRQLKKAAAIAAAVLAVGWVAFIIYAREQRLQAQDRQRQVGTDVAYGIQHLDAGRFLHALPPLVRALGKDEPAKQEKHRLRIAATLAQTPKLEQMWLESAMIRDGQFDRTGKRVILAVLPGAVVRSLERPGESSAPFGAGRQLRTACFSPDGKLALIANWTSEAEIWDWAAGKKLRTLSHSSDVYSAVFNPAGTLVLTACINGAAYLWDLRGGAFIQTFEKHQKELDYAGFSPDGSRIVTVGRDNTAFIWSTNGQVIGPGLKHKSWVFHASFSPDGERLVTASFDNVATVWDVASGKQLLPPLRHGDGVESAEYSPDGRLILTGCWDGTARLWDAATGRPLARNPILPHSSRVTHASFHPDGHRILTVCDDGTARLWNLAGEVMPGVSFDAALSPDGTRYLSREQKTLRVRDTATRKTLSSLPLLNSVTNAALNQNGRFLLAVTQSGSNSNTPRELSIWRSDTGAKFFSLAPFTNSFSKIVISDSGRWLVCNEGWYSHVIDLRTGKPLPPMKHPGTVTGAAFAADDKRLLTVRRNSLFVWELPGARLQHQLTVSNNISSFRCSADGRLALAWTADNYFTWCSAYMWDIKTGTLLGPPMTHRDGVLHGSFSPDNRKVVTSGEDFTALVWDWHTRQQPRKLPHEHQVRQAWFSPKGACILTVSRDTTARLWDSTTGEPLSPPIPNRWDIYQGAFLQEHMFVTANNKSNACLWSLQPDTRPAKQLLRLAYLLNGGLLDAEGNEVANPRILHATWEELRKQYPEDFTSSLDEHAGWHLRQAEAAAEENLWAVVLTHCHELAALGRGDQRARELCAQAQDQLSNFSSAPPGAQ